MNALIVLLVLATPYVIDACSTARRAPPPPPPPEAPPAPLAPPPIVKVVRTQEENVGFNKCYRKCSGQNAALDSNGKPVVETTSAFGVTCTPDKTVQSTYGSGPKTESLDTAPKYTTPTGQACAMKTDCVYECKFTVYTEVALRTITKPADCGCAFHINIVKPRPSTRTVGDVKYAQVAQTVTVGDFSLVVWDFKANRVIEKVPGFNLVRNEATKQAIAAQVQSGNTDDFTSLTAGFAGEVTRFENLPASLNLNLPENANNVPALQFEVTQTYTDTKAWNPPANPTETLKNSPNAYQSQCVPYWPTTPFCYNDKKRQINKACGSTANKVWMKKFFLFPKETTNAAAQGATYASRMITSFYTTADCRVKNGVMSVDAEFTQTIAPTDGGLAQAIGTWDWKRVFYSPNNAFTTAYVLGVPASFSPITEVWSKGYSHIEWFSYGGWNSPHPLVTHVCQSWTPSGAPTANTKYTETAQVHKQQTGIKCAPFDDAIKSVTGGVTCGTEAVPDRSLMAFINEGQVLNFDKSEDSILIVGKQSSTNGGCQTTPYADTVFDVLQFHGVIAGQEPITRAEKRSLHDDVHELGLVYDEEAAGFRHFLHPGAHEMLMTQRRKRAVDVLDALTSAVATPPNENDFDMRMATGTVDSNGGIDANGGDHPIELFPETFSAPVNIDPKANAAIVVDAAATTGSRPPPCNKGSIGCSCRVTGADPCDIGLTCASNSKCMLKDCQPGQSGCPCKNGACGDGLECKTDVCAAKSSCTVGTAGCECSATGCSDSSSCVDGLCLLSVGCASGSAGCVCSTTPVEFGSNVVPTDGQLFCNKGFECDKVVGSCLAPRCKSGSPGCRCKADATCDAGFQCDLKKNVCSVYACPAGDPGCQCLASGNCNKVGFRCEAFTSTGDRRCIADGDTCSPDGKTATQRCIDFCGVGNVLRCPPCANGRPYCKSIGAMEAAAQCALPENAKRPYCTLCLRDPFNAACAKTGDASSVIVAFAAVVVAVLVAMF